MNSLLTLNTDRSGTASRLSRGGTALCLMTLSLRADPSPKKGQINKMNKTKNTFYKSGHFCKTVILLVTSNVSKGPHCLFADVLMGRCDKANKGRNSPAFNNSSRLIRGSWGDVGQSPRGFKLDRRTVGQPQEGDKLGDEPGTDHLVDGRMLVSRQQFPAISTAHVSGHQQWWIIGSHWGWVNRYLAACVAWSCNSGLPLFTPVRISSTVHCRVACKDREQRIIELSENGLT